LTDAEVADTEGDVSDEGDSGGRDAEWPQLPQIELDVCLAPQAMQLGSRPPTDETPRR